LAEHGVKVDAIGHELRPDGPPGEDVDELENDFEGLKTTPEASSSPAPSNAEQKYASYLSCQPIPCESILLTLLQDRWRSVVFLSQGGMLHKTHLLQLLQVPNLLYSFEQASICFKTHPTKNLK
jgi:hypothetical protein